jgi:hypothetical protein
MGEEDMADIIGAIVGACIAAALAGILMLLRLVRLSMRGSLIYLAFSLIVGVYFGHQYNALSTAEKRAVKALNDRGGVKKLYEPELKRLPQGATIPYDQGERAAKEIAGRFASAFGVESELGALQVTAVNTLLDMRKQDVYARIPRSDFMDFLNRQLPGSLAARLPALMAGRRVALEGQAVILLLLGAAVSIIISLQRGRRPPEVPFERPESLPA